MYLHDVNLGPQPLVLKINTQNWYLCQKKKNLYVWYVVHKFMLERTRYFLLISTAKKWHVYTNLVHCVTETRLTHMQQLPAKNAKTDPQIRMRNHTNLANITNKELLNPESLQDCMRLKRAATRSLICWAICEGRCRISCRI